MNQPEIYTIGHSNHAIDQFVALLKQHGIEALADVRRFPKSRSQNHTRCLIELPTMANQILAIAPYWLDSVETWVFDDDAVGLVQEPFVSGIPEMIDELVADFPDARRGFRLLFSAAPFPGYQRKLTRLREEFGGWWYSSDEPDAEGWLCPALFRYFDQAPDEIYVKAEAKL